MESLDALITGNLFVFLFVFTRVGAALMTLPGFGDQVIPTNVRLLFAISFALILTPVIGPMVPAQPTSMSVLLVYILQESLVGFFLGLVARTLMSTLNTAGMVISFTMSLANANAFNPQVQSQSSVIGILLTFLGLVLLFTSNLHHMLILSIVHSYELIAPGASYLPVDDMMLTFVEAVNVSFLIAVQFSAPFLILSITFKTALGVVARLVPQIQVFFMGIPVQVLGGLIMMTAMLSMGMMFFLERFESFMMTTMGMW